MKAVDCEALAGSWTLGTKREGFEISHRVALPGGFGNEVIEANRDVLGQFDIEVGDEGEWTPKSDVAFMFGTPPCSGWSVMNTAKSANARGMTSGIHNCTWGLVHYAARCIGSDGRRGPEIVSFESVQQAWSQGRELMTAYLNVLRDRTGEDYKLTHIVMSGSSVGSAQYRPRYFWVGHRVPFGVDVESPSTPATTGDAIRDLAGHPLQRSAQPYLNPSTPYLDAKNLRNPAGTFTDHVQIADGTGRTNLDITIRVLELADGDWHPGEYQRHVLERLWDRGILPHDAYKWVDTSTGKSRGWGGPRRTVEDRPAYVIHGGGAGQFIHWDEDRWLTIRELTRLMGYPDTWRYPEGSKPAQISAWIGKNCPVQSGQWLSHWVKKSLEGEPGTLRMKTDGYAENEGLIHITRAFRGPEHIIAERV